MVEHQLQLQHGEVLLRPLALSDATALLGQVDEEMWAGMSTPLPRNREDMENNIRMLASMRDAYAFAVEYRGDVVGRTLFYDVHEGVRVDIGHTLYGRSVWGTVVNPTAKFLLLTHAFDQFKVHRAALRCDTRNTRSRAAIEKLGATFEGTLRKFRPAADGSIVDLYTFSIIRDEWEAVRDQLLQRIDE